MATVDTTLQNFIDGEPARSDAPSEAILNPATGEELAQAPNSSPQDVDRAVRAARAAFAEWSQSAPARRSQALLALAEILEENGKELARLEAEEFVAGSFLEGAPIVPVSSTTGEGIDQLKEAIERAALEVSEK